MKKNIVEMLHVSFSHKNMIIFDNLSLSIPRGKITAIIGPSGVGKTTLLRLIGGQLRPISGEVWFNNVNIPTLSRASLYEVRKKMGMLFQTGALFTDLNVFDNVAWSLREHADLPKTLLHSTVIMKLEAVGLRGATHLKPSELSGGMIRRTALARALALEPDLMMFDEPFVGQDPVTVQLIIKLIHKLKYALDMTFIIVSHDIPEVLSIADYTYLINERQILAQGTTHDLHTHGNICVRKFINGISNGSRPTFFPTQDYLQDLLGLR
ncbi:ATP-binding cassette domain-containing protein [Candidatus Erwinia haradaeae]|uniref:Intermembrane phospholipid transport system ATP-binding protein MlaF n=1 Tax=Candidatus Erwinia haradaeae TaxID=1922217 RepID=A0A451D9R9_9GAMM|nr:ATP-binding cassette domain-containing protein [Candidatus Erwinia haradaeae]VFP82977.1 Intermembrane phospholipid transport system ATP-binding protein MlaF [Candidatus Erwinia haradaeae]